MNTLTTTSVPIPPAPPTPPPPDKAPEEPRFVLHNIMWGDYIKIGEIFRDRPALRITYDRGTLEFMTTSGRHERYKYWLGRFFDIIVEELQWSYVPGGSMTFQRGELERGFEPDNCYWVENESAVREKSTWDPAVDPPPDVMLEVEVSRSAMARMPIFAAFRIPEIWYYDGDELRIYLLQPDGTYLVSERSRAFPSIPLKELARFFPPTGSPDLRKAAAAVRAWVRSLISKPS